MLSSDEIILAKNKEINELKNQINHMQQTLDAVIRQSASVQEQLLIANNTNAQLTATISELNQTIKELKERIGTNF